MINMSYTCSERNQLFINPLGKCAIYVCIINTCKDVKICHFEQTNVGRKTNRMYTYDIS
jgi:hypothetical protein